jgi:hypothetical protein
MTTSAKRWWWFLGGSVFLAGLVIGGCYFFKKDLANPRSKIVKPLLTDQLKKFINKGSNGLYQLKYDRFDLDIDSGKGLITNVKIIADTAVYHRLLSENNAPNNVLSLQIDSLILNDFGFLKTDSGRRFNIKAVTIKNPSIVLSNKRQGYNDSLKRSNSLIKGLMKDMLNMTSVNQITVNNMTFVYINKNDGDIKRTVLERWNMSITDFNLASLDNPNDSTKKKKPGTISVKRFVISTPDSLYRLISSNIRLYPEQRSMYITKFVLQPRLGKSSFYRKSGFNRDRLHFIYNRISMKNIDIERLLRRQQVHIGTMTVGSSWTEVYNNYHWPKRVRPVRENVYPHQRLQLLAFDVTIDTITMHNGYFRYAIAARKSEKTASLFMTNIESRIYQTSNNVVEKKRNPYLICRSTNLTMGAAKTRTKYVFNLASKRGAFSAYTHMGPVNAKAFNKLSAPLGLMEVKSGTINKMDMYFDATTAGAKGNIDLYFKDLKINLLKRDEDTDTLKKRGFLSFVTNAVMPNDNPKDNGKFKKGPINVTREPRMSFFGLIWKCTQDGMSSAVMGIDQQKEKPDENPVIQVIKKVLKPMKDQKQLEKDKN